MNALLNKFAQKKKGNPKSFDPEIKETHSKFVDLELINFLSNLFFCLYSLTINRSFHLCLNRPPNSFKMCTVSARFHILLSKLMFACGRTSCSASKNHPFSGSNIWTIYVHSSYIIFGQNLHEIPSFLLFILRVVVVVVVFIPAMPPRACHLFILVRLPLFHHRDSIEKIASFGCDR